LQVSKRGYSLDWGTDSAPLGQAPSFTPGLTHKMLERFARDKRSSLFGLFVSGQGEKKVLKHCHQGPMFKNFFFVTYTEAEKARLFIPGKPFKHSPIFVRPDPTQEEQHLCAPPVSKLLGLLTNSRTGLKGLPVTHTLAYFASSSVTNKRKKF
jgi:hypothetical protein